MIFQEVNSEKAMELLQSTIKVPIHTDLISYTYIEETTIEQAKAVLLSNIAFQFIAVQLYCGVSQLCCCISVTETEREIGKLRCLFTQVLFMEKTKDMSDCAFAYFGEGDIPPADYDDDAISCLVQLNGLPETTKQAILQLKESNQLNAILCYFAFHQREGQAEVLAEYKFYHYIERNLCPCVPEDFAQDELVRYLTRGSEYSLINSRIVLGNSFSLAELEQCQYVQWFAQLCKAIVCIHNIDGIGMQMEFVLHSGQSEK